MAKLTRAETKRRLGYVFIGFFTFYLVDPIQAWMSQHVPINPIALGIIGFFATLYYFDF